MNPYPFGFGNFNPAMPSSGYDGSGINPGNMYGLNHMFPQFRPQMGGNYPAQGYPMPPMMSSNDPGQHAPPMGAYGGPQQSPYGGPMMAMRPRHQSGTRPLASLGFNMFTGGRPPSTGGI